MGGRGVAVVVAGAGYRGKTFIHRLPGGRFLTAWVFNL